MVCRTFCGREFQMAGPDTEKPRRPNRVVSALGTTRSPRLADRRLRRSALEETAMQSSWPGTLQGQCRPGSSERTGRSWTRAGSELGANEARLECWPRCGRTLESSRWSSPLHSGWIGDGRVETGWHRRGRCCNSRSYCRWSCAQAWGSISE